MCLCEHKRCNWLCQVNKLLNTFGFGDVWVNQCVNNDNVFLTNVKSRLTDIFIQERDGFFAKSSKCLLYKYVEDTFCLQYYLKNLLPDPFLCLLAKFRMSSHQLFIEQGRYANILRSDRICQHCNLQK